VKNIRPLVINRKKEAIIYAERTEEKLPGLVLPDGVACADDPELVSWRVIGIPDGADWLDFKVGDKVIVGVPSGFQRVSMVMVDKTKRFYLLSSRFVVGVEVTSAEPVE
jgi:hypothetical protein